MIYRNIIRMFYSVMLITAFSGITQSAMAAEENLYPGNACMSSNTATGAFFHWNIQGLQNNSGVDRFVVCPFVLDQNQWDATPRLSASVNIFMPPGYGVFGATGPTCFLRFLNANDNINNAGQTIVVNQVFTIGFFDGSGVLGDADGGSTAANVNNSTLGNGHLVCILPRNGGQLRQYRILQQ